MRANNLRKGNVVLFNDTPCKITEFMHVTPGKGQAVIQCKMKNLLTGMSTETRFLSAQDVNLADVFTSKGVFLYSDNDGYHFMDNTSFEQFNLSEDMLGDQIYYLQENMEVSMTFFNDGPIGVELPNSVTLTIMETEPILKSTNSSSPKPAKTDTGLQMTVPAFIKEGDRVIVNTDDGSYISRAE